MKVFTCVSFKGHYPVGTAAVIVANDAEDAAMLLCGNLAAIGLIQPDGRWPTADDMVEVNTSKVGVQVLNDGNY